MQTLLLPVTAVSVGSSSTSRLPRRAFPARQVSNFALPLLNPHSASSKTFRPLSFPAPSYAAPNHRRPNLSFTVKASEISSQNGEAEKEKLAQVAKRLENTSRQFKRFGTIGFWAQLVSTVVAAVILSFSIVVTGKVSSPATFYATAAGIAAAFISVFWSFGYIRLSDKLRRTANEPSKAPPRANVVKSLQNGIIVNLLGLGAAILGMQATVGVLVAKALTSSANPYYQGIAPGYSPVLALDVFLVQASANTILSHFLGLVFSLGLLRSVTLPPSESIPVPRVA
ncbi:protein TIC 21, chloroplastic [Juglans regia]|uniref:Protein TIC 21, chloroplastic n=2 Tax=Juglans regia TaxID=51240 RepID=A0A2I4F807_JUGRE|nr:protein TIC 21, chloroplastic [Juglans regia]XP_018827781.1 protein TIC 21, chloroplastic [Juglans regia]